MVGREPRVQGTANESTTHFYMTSLRHGQRTGRVHPRAREHRERVALPPRHRDPRNDTRTRAGYAGVNLNDSPGGLGDAQAGQHQEQHPRPDPMKAGWDNDYPLKVLKALTID